MKTINDVADYELTESQKRIFNKIKENGGKPFDLCKELENLDGYYRDFHYYITIKGNDVSIEISGDNVPDICHPAQAIEWRQTDDAGPWSANYKFTVPKCKNDEEFQKYFWSTFEDLCREGGNDFKSTNPYFSDIHDYYCYDLIDNILFLEWRF